MKDYQGRAEDELRRTSTQGENGVYENTGSGTSENRADLQSQSRDIAARDAERVSKAHQDIAADTSDKSDRQKLSYHTPHDFSFGHIAEVAGRLANSAKNKVVGTVNKAIDPLQAAQKIRK